MKRVLMLGAGLVTGPIVDYLLALPDVTLSIGTLMLDEARAKLRDRPRGRAFELDVEDRDALGRSVAEADLVVSFVPWTFHPLVARQALDHRVPMLTASYVSDELRALDDEAQRRDVLILNEMGLDPGLDHLSAMRAIDRLRDAGEALRGFRSVCGGLPAPEAADPPWRYKFSWSPRGALLAARADARFRRDAETVEVPGPELFRHAEPYPIEDLGRFECYPNRDSLKYLPRYAIDDIDTMFRGTLRWPGWAAAMDTLVRLGLLALEPHAARAGETMRDLVRSRLPRGEGTLESRLRGFVRIGDPNDVVARMDAVGLLEASPLPDAPTAPIDLLVTRFAERLRYADGERDMVVQEHVFDSVGRDGTPRRRVSTLVSYGEPGGDSATARTVSLPAAIAAKHMLEGRYRLTGVRAPVHREIYEPVLAELESFDIRFVEREVTVDGD